MDNKLSIKIKGKVSLGLKEEILRSVKMDETENLEGFFVDYSEINVFLNTKFEELIIENFVRKINWELVYITNETLFSLDSIDEGYKTICFFKIENELEFLSKIPVIKDWSDENKISLKLLVSPAPQRVIK